MLRREMLATPCETGASPKRDTEKVGVDMGSDAVLLLRGRCVHVSIRAEWQWSRVSGMHTGPNRLTTQLEADHAHG